MKQIKKIQWEARRYWRLWFGVRLERFVGAIRWRYIGKHRKEIRVWRAFGCPSEYTPHRAFLQLACVRFLGALVTVILVFVTVCVIGYIFFVR